MMNGRAVNHIVWVPVLAPFRARHLVAARTASHRFARHGHVAQVAVGYLAGMSGDNVENGAQLVGLFAQALVGFPQRLAQDDNGSFGAVGHCLCAPLFNKDTATLIFFTLPLADLFEKEAQREGCRG